MLYNIRVFAHRSSKHLCFPCTYICVCMVFVHVSVRVKGGKVCQ